MVEMTGDRHNLQIVIATRNPTVQLNVEEPAGNLRLLRSS